MDWWEATSTLPTIIQVAPHMGLFWEEFSLDDRFETPSRVITEADVTAFAELSGDLNPLHTDVEYCRSIGLDGLQPQTNLVIAITSGLLSRLGLFDSTGLALVAMGWRSVARAQVGDMIRCRMRIVDLTEVSSSVGSLQREVLVINQHDLLCGTGWHEVHVRRRLPG